MLNDNFYEKVVEYTDWFIENEDGQPWDIDDIAYEMRRCRDDGEWFLSQMSDELFDEFSHDVIEVYLNR